ncbi:MAG: YqeG family HAD IIIA-type phosphatase [Trueperaceae bacterium]|nr:YqeG family HAD IIIA-type phosphatase [Trueperaceae bacterium]
MRLRPDIRVEHVRCLTPAVLGAHGLRGLLLDLDETLQAADASTPSEEVRAWTDGMRRAGIALAIVSNGTRARVAAAREALDVPALALAGKPRRRAYQRGLDLLGRDPAEVAMVGDQLFTDVLGAHSAGLGTVLVTPLTKGGLPHTRALRVLERAVLKGGEHGRPVHR